MPITFASASFPVIRPEDQPLALGIVLTFILASFAWNFWKARRKAGSTALSRKRRRSRFSRRCTARPKPKRRPHP